jgi:hypothetical protein
MKCKQQRSHYQWCQPCERKQCEENFVNWTSGNKEIDKLLQDTQLNSTKPQTFLEWIPFENLKNINILDTVLGNTGSTVYSAIWKEGPRVLWNQQNEKYERTETKVTIELYKDNNQIDKILNEVVQINDIFILYQQNNNLFIFINIAQDISRLSCSRMRFIISILWNL